ncbi:MAG: hypothetical protein ISR82_08255 [Candidatus Marinimicrobia bacterium]|nr:hypothetical protein [Candidatus Neomarinimicrobiota bacterium]MBL7011198.1 hypothetical protein [Candidatus Neomarinimicrobiota bacterium]MBL7031486.1 hypothetical protein [Candidatus Neomarinimicrobiota bacterium]
MNKARTILLSGLATVTLTITLIEAGFLKLESQPLIAQEDGIGLTLEKDGEQVLIPLEEWVIVSSAYDPSNTVGGLYMGMTVDALRIQEKGEPFEREIPIDEIGSIFTGKTKSMKEYVWGGVKLGGLVSVGLGGVATVVFLADGGGADAFLCGGIMALFSGIYTVPGGVLIGFIRGKVAEGKAVEYVIGNGEWVVVK